MTQNSSLSLQLCHGSRDQSRGFHHRVPCSLPGQSMWNLWWKKWEWDRFFSKYFGFPLSVSFCQCSILIYSSILALNSFIKHKHTHTHTHTHTHPHNHSLLLSSSQSTSRFSIVNKTVKFLTGSSSFPFQIPVTWRCCITCFMFNNAGKAVQPAFIL